GRRSDGPDEPAEHQNGNHQGRADRDRQRHPARIPVLPPPTHHRFAVQPVIFPYRHSSPSDSAVMYSRSRSPFSVTSSRLMLHSVVVNTPPGNRSFGAAFVGAAPSTLPNWMR